MRESWISEGEADGGPLNKLAIKKKCILIHVCKPTIIYIFIKKIIYNEKSKHKEIMGCI